MNYTGLFSKYEALVEFKTDDGLVYLGLILETF